MHVLDSTRPGPAPSAAGCRDEHDDPAEQRVERLASELMISIASHGSSAARLTSSSSTDEPRARPRRHRAVRHRRHVDGAARPYGRRHGAPLGLAFVAVASALRVPAVAELLKTHAPGGTHEVAKHVALVAGCLFVGVWAYSTTTGHAPRTRYVALAAGLVGGAMIALAVASGPWTTLDLDAQTSDRPLMWFYRALYYGTFVAATATFAVSCVRTRSRRPVRLRWGMDVAAAGALVAVVWAVVSFVALLLHEPGSAEPYLVLGVRTRYLVLAASVLLTVGIVGQLASSAAYARERRRDLEHLHAFVVATVGDGGLPGSSAAVDEYHRTIEIFDGLAALALHSRRDDVDHVRVAVPGSPREVILAYQLQVAATRRARATPRASTLTTGRTCSPTTTRCAGWGARCATGRARRRRPASSRASDPRRRCPTPSSPARLAPRRAPAGAAQPTDRRREKQRA